MTRSSSWLLSLLSLVAALASPSRAAGGQAQVLITVPEALELAFPGCTVEKQTLYLSKEQQKEAAKLCKGKLEGRVVRAYSAKDAKGKFVGTAYFDTHRVRTNKETVMVVVTPEQKVARVEVLAFGEPLDYVPNEVFYGQFKKKKLGPELTLKRGVRNVAGATLTCRASVDAARRVLAVHRILSAPAQPAVSVASR